MIPIALTDDGTDYPRRVIQAVILSQMLFSAGNVLTTGGFLYYYADAFGPSAVQLSFLLILPELAESLGFLARPLSRSVGSLKRTWLISLLSARLFACGVPLMAAPVLASGAVWRFELLVGWVAGWYVLQGIAYVCFIAWLSDLMPETSWGRLFARREMAMLGIRLIVPVAVGVLRRRWADALPDDRQLITYVGIFVVGNSVVAASILPMLRLPDLRGDARLVQRANVAPVATWRVLGEALTHPGFRWILLHSWWLSFAQGLTQSAFFRYQTSVLKLSVETYYVLNGVMLALQLPLTAWAGRLCDRGREKSLLLWSVTAVSGAMVFWLAATPQRWWLLCGAYVIWGLFGFVNVSGQNLMLKLAPRGDNTAHVSLFRQVGGLCAALAGLVGGWALDRLTTQGASLEVGGLLLGPYQLIFLASFLGRVTAGVWVVPIRSPVHQPTE